MYKENKNVKMKKSNNATTKILVTVEYKNGVRYINKELPIDEVRKYFPLDDVCPVDLEQSILKHGEYRVGDYYDPEGPCWVRKVINEPIKLLKPSSKARKNARVNTREMPNYNLDHINMNCYNCGIRLDNSTNHVEHIPAKNLFSTHPNEYKQNLLTVAACYTCNVELYSKIDQEIRDAVGILNDSDELKIELTKKAIKSIARNSNWKDRFFLLDNGNSFEVSFSYNNLISLHIKNFKGLFYATYNKPISNEYGIGVIAEGDENIIQAQNINTFFREFLNYDSDWNIIGHSTIFKYKIKAIVKGENGVFYSSGIIDQAIGFVCIMEYHETIRPLVYAIDKEFMKSITL